MKHNYISYVSTFQQKYRKIFIVIKARIVYGGYKIDPSSTEKLSKVMKWQQCVNAEKVFRTYFILNGTYSKTFNPFVPTVPTCAVRETASLGIMGSPRVPPLCRDAVSRTANVERTGRHKWVKSIPTPLRIVNSGRVIVIILITCNTRHVMSRNSHAF